MSRTALITGANKGIGFETARQLHANGLTVLIGARSTERGERAASELGARFVQLDVTDPSSVRDAAKWVESEYGLLDILVNNAGIGGPRDAASATTIEAMREVFDTNLFGVIAVTNAMLALLRRSKSARIVNVSSEVGSLQFMSNPKGPFWELSPLPYPASKCALNMVTLQYAKELRDTPIKVNMVTPGYTATDLTGGQGFKTAEQGAVVVTRMALLGDDGPTGTFVDENGPLPW